MPEPAMKTATEQVSSSPNKEKQSLADHIQLGEFGKSVDGKLFQEVHFSAWGKSKTVVLPLAELTTNSPEIENLTNLGAHLISPAAKLAFINKLQEHERKTPTLHVATRLGILHDKFILPSRVIGPNGEQVRVCLPVVREERFNRYRVGGSYKGWQSLAKLCRGNTRMIFSMALSFSGAIAAMLRLEQTNAMLVGPAESGKSSVQMIAGSTFGCHLDTEMATRLGFAQPFNATINDLEYEFLASNHTLVSFDETRSLAATDKEIAQLGIGFVMRLDSGVEKGRMDATTRHAAASPIILSSNLSLEQFGAAAGRTIDDALHGRLISIPPPSNGTGMFENLHDEENLVDFCMKIRNLALTHFGHGSVKFLKALMKENAEDPEALRAWLSSRRGSYLSHARKISAEGRSINRIHEKMATVYAAARFAIKHSILPWKTEELRKSLLTCTHDHISLVEEERSNLSKAADRHSVTPRGTPRAAVNSNSYGRHQLTQLRDYLRANLDKIIDMDACEGNVSLPHERSKWPIIKLSHKKNGTEYLLSEERLIAILGDRTRYKALRSELHAVGDIATEKGSDGRVRYSIKRQIPGQDQRWQCIAIKAAAIDCQASVP